FCPNLWLSFLFFFQAEDGIRAFHVTGVQTCALPILRLRVALPVDLRDLLEVARLAVLGHLVGNRLGGRGRRLGLVAVRLHLARQDRKSTRLNSSHVKISYAVFCLKKKT